MKVIWDGVIIRGTLPSGTGHNTLTRDPATGQVTEIAGVPLTSTLPNGSILIGNASNVATPVVVFGDITIANTGVAQINPGVIVNADISDTAGINVSKLGALTANKAIVTNASGILTPSTATDLEVSYLSGVTSSIQTQINSKQATITGAASTVTTSNLNPNVAVITNGSGKLANSATTATEISYISGVTSPIQPQINAKLSATVTSPALGDMLRYNGSTFVNFPHGTTGQVLTIDGFGVPNWAAGTSNGIPVGGTTGQYLAKVNGTDYNVSWNTLTLSKITDVTALAADVNILSGLAGAGLTGTELGYSNGVNSPIQTQIDGKLTNLLDYNHFWIGDVSNRASVFPNGSDGDVLTMSGGIPTWAPSSGGGSGNVTGIPPTVDNAIARWNGTLGDSIQNSIPIITDLGEIQDVAGITVTNQGIVRLSELTVNGTNYVGLQAAPLMASNYTITFPAAAPSANDYLKYNGSDYIWAPAAGGAVTSVSGTAGRITSTGGTTPVIDIDATYVGQTSITTLGTIGTGTWNATNISLAKGGTGTALSAPIADRIFFYDQSAGSTAFLTVGTGLNITGTTITNDIASDPRVQYFTGDGVTTVFTVTDASTISIYIVTVGQLTRKESTEYSKNNTAKTVTFTSAPPSGQTVGIYYFAALVVSGGGGGAVSSVNGSTGAVLIGLTSVLGVDNNANANKITNLAPGTNPSDAVRFDQLSSLTAAGSSTQVQFNSAGSFGASNEFTWSGTTLTIGTATSGSNGTLNIGGGGAGVGTVSSAGLLTISGGGNTAGQGLTLKTAGTQPMRLNTNSTDRILLTNGGDLQFASVNNVAANQYLKADSSNNVVSLTTSQVLDDLGVNPSRVSTTPAGTTTLDMASKKRKTFLFNATVSSNFTLALTNATSIVEFDFHINITGTVVITCPSTFRMMKSEKDAGRWNDSTQQLTLVGGTATPFHIVVTYDGTIYKMDASSDYL